uniref:Ig-like domain-containing protein n=1 Tax=Poecilia formosa TaxID=48698 RepID=A0A096M112_POEFO
MFFVAFLLLAAASCVKCEQLTQAAAQAVQSGQSLTISCQVSYSLGSYPTFWIRQAAGKTLEWIGAARTGYTTDYNNMMKNKFSITLQDSSKTVTLNGQNMQHEDSGVYYCARRDTVIQTSSKAVQKLLNKLFQTTREGLFCVILCILLY